MKHEHILVIRFSALGDVAMTVPIIWALARQYPDVRITMLSRPIARTFFEDLAPNVSFMGADVKGEYHGMHGLNALYRRLAAKQFTAIADLHNVLRSEYLRFRFNVGRYRVEHIDKHRNLRHQLTAKQPKKILKQLPTSFQNYIDVFARLGYPIAPENLCFRSMFTLPDSDNMPCGGNLNLLAKAIGPKLSWERWIGIAPYAMYDGKTYPIALMEQVIEQLMARYPKARIFLFGRGDKEDKTFKEWTAKWSQCLYVGEHTENLYQELIIMSHLDVMVSMDSSNMHMASLTNTPVVSIWGATHPYAGFLGWGQSKENIVELPDLNCRPCSIYGQKKCLRNDYACLHGIKPGTIIEKVCAVLDNTTTQP